MREGERRCEGGAWNGVDIVLAQRWYGMETKGCSSFGTTNLSQLLPPLAFPPVRAYKRSTNTDMIIPVHIHKACGSAMAVVWARLPTSTIQRLGR